MLNVGISDWKVCKKPDVLVTYALGSCMGICIYDKTSGISGLSHIMLPNNENVSDDLGSARMKFANTAIPDMLAKMLTMGAVRSRLTAKIAGGAMMFATQSDRFNIGERNIAAVKETLGQLRIPIVAQDVGSNYGRTVFFYSEDGKVEIKSTLKGVKNL